MCGAAAIAPPAAPHMRALAGRVRRAWRLKVLIGAAVFRAR